MSTEPPHSDRRGFLKCMTWAGSAMLWTVSGGIPRSHLIEHAEAAAETGFTFAQVSDSHLGFDKPANADVTATFQEALNHVTNTAARPAFLIHTGDITHLSKPAQFDTGAQLLAATRLQIYTVPGEHDILEDDGKSYLNRYGKDTKGDGWYSFNAHGVHFIGLVNVVNLKGNGLGDLGHEQLAWLEADVKHLSASTPIVLFAHVPLWIVYQDWGWGTQDGAQALSYLKRFGSVTVLNGHIHQVMQKIEGHVSFHTARSTAFPQGVPGVAKAPGPMTVPPGELKNYLGTAKVTLVSTRSAACHRRYAPRRLTETDMSVFREPGLLVRRVLLCALLVAPIVPLLAWSDEGNQIGIDNFKFNPTPLTVGKGTEITWINHDDIPHSIVLNALGVRSKAMDTDGTFTYKFDKAGTFFYVCGLHPFMQAKIVVK